jgi:hypothetical protein
MKTSRGILSADYKVAGGKLLRVKLSLDEGTESTKIHSITITGDFFMHPEDAIDELEHTLTGVIYKKDLVQTAVEAFFNSEVEVIGAGAADFVHVIMNVK